LEHGAQRGDVGGGVADGDLAVFARIAMRLHVAGGGFDIGCGDGAVSCGEYLVANEEASQVVILVEFIHDGGKRIALSLVPFGGSLLDLCVEGIKVKPDVDTSVRKGLHAGSVVGIGVHMVDADRVGTDGFHERGVEAALGCIDEGVVGDELVGDALDVELVAIAGEELGAFC